MLDYFGRKIIISDKAFERTRTMKFKYPWWSRPFNGFKKYKFVTGKRINDKKVMFHEDFVIMSQRVYDHFKTMDRIGRTFLEPVKIINPHSILNDVVC